MIQEAIEKNTLLNTKKWKVRNNKDKCTSDETVDSRANN